MRLQIRSNSETTTFCNVTRADAVAVSDEVLRDHFEEAQHTAKGEPSVAWALDVSILNDGSVIPLDIVPSDEDFQVDGLPAIQPSVMRSTADYIMVNAVFLALPKGPSMTFKAPRATFLEDWRAFMTTTWRPLSYREISILMTMWTNRMLTGESDIYNNGIGSVDFSGLIQLGLVEFHCPDTEEDRKKRIEELSASAKQRIEEKDLEAALEDLEKALKIPEDGYQVHRLTATGIFHLENQRMPRPMK